MSDDIFSQVRTLVRQHRYDEARALLRTSDDPRAAQWLERLNLAAPRANRIVHHRGWTILGTVLAILVFTVAAVVLVYVLVVEDDEDEAVSEETLVLSVDGATTTAVTDADFEGPVDIAVSGTLSGADSQQADAVYRFVEDAGIPLVSDEDDWTLYINQQPAHTLTLSREKPVFNPEHTYIFRIDAPGGPLAFSLPTEIIADSQGSLTITVSIVE